MRGRKGSSVIAVALLLLTCGTAFPQGQALPPSLAAAPFGGIDHDRFCVREIGDFNGDGLPDLAAAEKQARRIGPRTAVILLGGHPAPPALDSTNLAASGGVIVLRGAAAAPFMCLPQGVERSQQARRAPAAPQVPAAALRPPLYRLVVLDPAQPYPAAYPDAFAINAAGRVVGEYAGQAVLYDRTSLRSLGSLGGDRSVALGINSDGDVVGVSLTGETDARGWISSPFIYDGLRMERIGMLIGAANDINDHDQIVGGMTVEAEGRQAYRAFLHQEGRTRDLGTLGGPGSEAHSINAFGQIAGEADAFVADTGLSSTHAFIYDQGAMADLGALGRKCSDAEDPSFCYEESVASDINERGQIVGFSSTDDGETHAFSYAAGRMEDIGTLGGRQSWAFALNNSGQVVGTSLTEGDAAYAPFLYDQGTLYNLNALIVDLPPGGALPFQARDINDFGQIVGTYLILDPVYEQLRPGRELSYGQVLGTQFSFEYWVALPDALAGTPRGAWVAVEVQVQTAEEPGGGSGGRRLPRRWVGLDGRVGVEEWGTGWRRVVWALPKQMRGRAATLHLRARRGGATADPLIYLRRLNMND